MNRVNSRDDFGHKHCHGYYYYYYYYYLNVLRHTARTTVDESVPKITVNNTGNLFLNCNRHFANFKP